MYRTVFMLVLATAAFGSVEEGLSKELRSSYKDCPYNTTDTRITNAIALNNHLDYCAMPSAALIEGIVTINTTEEYREFLKGHCSKVPRTQQCIANVTAESKLCLNATEQVLFGINRDFLESSVKIMCRDDGERLAVMLGDEMICLDPTNELVFFRCLNATVFAMAEVVKDNTAYTLRRYRAIRTFKECVEDIAQCQDHAGEKAIKTLVNDILEQMKCFSQDGEAVLCEGLE